MTPAIARTIDAILDSEGGIADVSDGKGITRFGQTPAWLEAHGLPKPATRDAAFANYALWMSRLKLDALIAIDEWTGFIVVDMAVHFGEGTAIRTLQRSLGVKDDGIIGPHTLTRYQSVAATRQFRQKFLAQKGRAYGELLGSQKVDRRKWAEGWMNRYAQQIEGMP